MSNPKTEFSIVKRIRKIAPLVEQVAKEMGYDHWLKIPKEWYSEFNKRINQLEVERVQC